MIALMVLVLWFGFVAVYLVRQWWVSDLALVREGVPAPEPATLPVVARPANWSGMHVAGSAAR